MKNLLTLLFIVIHTLSNAQIITEIMYNPPEDGVDSLEYIEIYNNTDSTINFSDFSLIGVSLLFDLGPILEPDSYLVVCKDNEALFNNFGIDGIPWSSGALSNDGEELGIINASGDTIFSITYSSMEPWPLIANGSGPSIELCDLNSDPTDAANWNPSQGFTNVIVNDRQLAGSPAATNAAVCQIPDYREIAISEILYESPSWDNDLQYIELYNYGTETINLNNWMIAGDINFINLPNAQLGPGEFYLIGSDPLGLIDFGVTIVDWGDVNQISLDPQITLINPNGDEVVTLDIDEDRGFVNPDPGQAIELCDPEMDNNTALNWAISLNELTVAGNQFSGTPSIENTCTMVGTSSTSNNDIANTTSIFPNPTNSEINVISDYDIESIEIYDQMGRLIKKINTQQNIDISDISIGQYYAKLYFNEFIVIKSLILIE